ncbi:ABC transporter ATP-binding protein [Thermodesulfobacteriota bacterium]
MTLYALKGLRKRFDGRCVLDIADLELEAGRILSLMGPNGAGKSTLLEILAFLSDPTEGEVRFQGERVDFVGKSLVDLRRRVAFVQQSPILFTTSVAKNVEYPLRIRKDPKTRRQRTVDELLDLVGMGAFKSARANTLSGGETRRVAIAQALACSPQVLLLDEPTANVDVEHRIILERIVRHINQERRISVIFTTHDVTQASRLADRTVFLLEGKPAPSLHENIFAGFAAPNGDGKTKCTVPGTLQLEVRGTMSGPVRVSVNPRAIIMARNRHTSRDENVFRGRLVQLFDEGNDLRASFDVGVPLSVVAPKREFVNLAIGMGDEAWLFCPPEEIEVF